jgi:Ca-activated chloride channel family protein
MITTTNHTLSGIQLTSGQFSMPVTHVDINGKVDGRGIVWTVEAGFSNILTSPTEATFSLPLPHGGAVVGMSMKIGNREIAAEIKEREAARIEYENAKDAGFTAAIFEQQRAEIFTIGVGNILPGEPISVVVTIHDSASIDGNEASLRLPTMIKQRFTPGDVPDAHTIDSASSPDHQRPRGSINILFASNTPDIVCDTDASAEVTTNRVTVHESALEGDIVLRWSVNTDISTAKWVADADDPNMGTIEVLLRVDAPKNVKRKRKAVQVMLDRSGSMSSHYLEWARRITSDVLAGLTPEDLIHVLTFDSVVEAFTVTQGGFQKADRQVKQLIERELSQMTARGGTELTDALQASGAVLATLDDREDAEEFDRVALLITDGAYGDESKAAYHRENEFKGVRVIAVAIGENANGFLEVLASNGTCVFVSSDGTLAEASSKVQSRLDAVVHSQVQILAEGLTDIAPSIAPDVYPHVLTTLTGRMPRPGVGATVELVSQQGFVSSLEISISNDTSATTRWASQYLKTLDYRIMSINKNSTELEEKIVELSIKYRVLSKYTAWLAVDYSRKTDQVIVQTMPTFESEELQIAFLQVSYSHSPSFNNTPFKINHHPLGLRSRVSPYSLKMLNESLGANTVEASPSQTRFKRLKKLIAFLTSLVRRRKKSRHRR